MKGNKGTDGMIPHVNEKMFQDPFKYVEDRFQSVGGDFKKFFSDVVGDLFPQSSDPANHKAKPVAQKKKNSAINSCSETETVSDCAVKQSSVAIETVDQADELQSTVPAGDECRNAETSKCQKVQGSDTTEQVVIDTDHENKRVALDSVSDEVSCDVMSNYTEFDNTIMGFPRGSPLSGLTSPSRYSPLDNEMFFDLIMCGTESPDRHVFPIPSWEKPFGDEVEETQLAFSFTGCATESPNGLLSPNPALSTSLKYEIEEILPAFSTTGLVTVAPKEPLSPIPALATAMDDQVEETLFVSSCTKCVTESPNGPLSPIPALIKPVNDEVEETLLVSSSTECVTESPNGPLSPIPALVTLTNDEVEETLLASSSTECVTESPNRPLSPIPALVTPNIDELVETLLASSFSHLSMKSIDDSAVDVAAESGMETVNLLDELNLEESCVFVDDPVLYSVSRRAQKLASYKKKIKGLFSFKKRVAKEYEQLPIWYGDTDIDSKPETRNSQTRRLCDSEWELL